MKFWKSFILYFIVGATSLVLATFAATQFLPKLLAQETAAPATPPPIPSEPSAEALPANPENLPPVENIGAAAADPTFNSDTLKQYLREYEYSGATRRDPFSPFFGSDGDEIVEEGVEGEEEPVQAVTPLQRFDLDQIKLLGVIWGVKNPRAMMKDPTGKIHVVTKNAKIGRNKGYIAVIREGELVVVESFDDEGQTTYQTRVMKVSQ